MNDANFLEAKKRIYQSYSKDGGTHLDLSGLQLTQMPLEIKKLQKLNTLIISNNFFKNLKFLTASEHHRLRYLDASGNQIKFLPKFFDEFINLKYLNLSRNRINIFPEIITDLYGLTQLIIGSNGISVLPKKIGNLSNLKLLTLYRNRIGFLPKDLTSLSKLQFLDVAGNDLKSLPEGLKELSQLKELDLSGNQFNQITNLFDLNNLERLSISGSHLTGLPRGLQKLKKLIDLNIAGNRLTYFPESICELTNLKFLNISNNLIESLPEKIIHLKSLEGLQLENNLFDFGPEIHQLSPIEKIKEILDWQKAKDLDILKPINEAKAIFIGESNYGKSHLIDFLKNNRISRKIETTHGIERSKINLSKENNQIQINLWDLGGQQFMRSTHQFFFSERTLYVLVTIARKEEKEIVFWLNLVKNIGKNAPVLIVINQIDTNSHDIDRIGLQRDFPNIVGFVRTAVFNSKNDEINAKSTIDTLRNAIRDIVFNPKMMPSVFEKRRPEWFLVKSALEKLEEENKDYISYSDYVKLDYIKELNEEEQKRNLKLLSILGTVISFIDDSRLFDTNVINPKWIMEGVYKIINDNTVKDLNKGRVHLDDLNKILSKKKYPRSKHAYLLDLMHKFQVCFPSNQTKDLFFIPDLFDDIEPVFEWHSQNTLKYRFHYGSHTPDNFIVRFIVTSHEDIIENNFWKKGVYISNGTCQAKIYREIKENIVNIEIAGALNERRGFLYSIRETFRKFHNSWEDLEIKPQVYHKGYWLNHEQLLNREIKRKPMYHDELDEDLDVTTILNGYSRPEERIDNNIELELLKSIDKRARTIEKSVLNVENISISNYELVKKFIASSNSMNYPNLFTLKPKRISVLEENHYSTPYELQLYCSHPSCIHPVGNPYEVLIPKKWLEKILPYVNNCIHILKNISDTIPFATYAKLGANSFLPSNLTPKSGKEYFEKLEYFSLSPKVRAYEIKKATESEMNIIKFILDEHDQKKNWMNLLQKVAKDGDFFWVCPEHAMDYK